MSFHYSVLNEEIIDDMAAILGDGYAAIFEEQLLQATSYIEEIRHFLANDSVAKVPKRAHALKSSAGQVGLQGIHFLAQDLEYACAADAEKGEISQRSRDIFSRLVHEYDGAVRCLYGYMANKNPRRHVLFQ
jgi:HPt (histidine-containing phosphotransfer) domain-containing protein